MDSFQNTESKNSRLHWRDHFNFQVEKFSEPAKALDFSNQKLMKQVHEGIVDAISIKRKCRVLDVGCGLGDLEIELYRKYKTQSIEIVCMDIAEKVLKKCKERLEHVVGEGYALEFVQTDILNMAFKNSQFDVVIASESLQYVNPYLAFEEILRVTKKGGTIVLSVPNKLHPVIQKAELRNRGKYRAIELDAFRDRYLKKVSEIYVRPLIFAEVQNEKPYIDNEFKDISLISETETKIANRFIIRVEV